MPKTREQQRQSLQNPALCELLPIRDFLDNVMVRTDGSYVAGVRVSGALTYFADDDGRNETKELLESLFRTVPEQSMRLQFRYEVVEGLHGLLTEYEQHRRTEQTEALVLERHRVGQWREKESEGEYLTRLAAIYLIWNPEKHRRLMTAAGGQMLKKGEKKPGFSLSVRKSIERSKKEHVDALAEFESIVNGVDSSLKRAAMGPERMTDEELFLEIKRALNPSAPDTARLRDCAAEERYISVREQAAAVSILGDAENYINVDGVLWSLISLKRPPDGTYPGILRNLLTVGFPVVLSTQVSIPDQRVVLDKYKKRLRKMQAAQIDSKGNQRVDIEAQVATRELMDIQAEILASSVKTAKVSLTIAVRTSRPAFTSSEYEAAERELANRRQQVLHIVSQLNGARAYGESLAQRRLLISSMPGMAEEDSRDHDLLTPHAADLIPMEMPWAGTPRSPLMLFETPYRQLIPFSPFDASLENANAIVAAASGAGKSVVVGRMLLTCGRQDVQVSIIERGDSYLPAVTYMGGQMITMSLDSRETINPFDLEAEERVPSNDHLAFLKNLTRFMIGDSGTTDTDLLDNLLLTAIAKTYDRASMRSGNTIPTYSDLKDELENYHDRDKSEIVNREARLAATKLRAWVENGMYAQLFDRPTTIDMSAPWLYFNIEQLKDDPKLETAMSLLIAYATNKRAMGKGNQRCITVLDECWALLQSPSLGPVVVQLFRTARKRNACVWGLSQAVEDFTGTPEKPNDFGGAILTTTSTKLIGRQKGNIDVLRKFVHLNETAIHRVKHLGMTEKGKKSEFLLVIGEKSETTHSLYIVTTPIEYWLLTTFPREKWYRQYWLIKHSHLSATKAYERLALAYPNGLSALDDLPEERSGEVVNVALGRPQPVATVSDEIGARVLQEAWR
ncbi:MAG TPA: hypothetical protein VMU57_10640 [Edaphobacter sp.]|uniref:VirB4 family type IV secretion system protein n=1 Tax=Edaphobacter sp. TaxID=1934404 RepID=UPI002C6DE50D|nr:hypothetical protein [Edaphobacter sp.]HUZ95360.1 hypothetical protein [Edaphobacter sp.]